MIKDQGCADGRPQREYMTREEANSPTVSLEKTMYAIDAKENRYLVTTDNPGPFLHTEMKNGQSLQ